MQNSQVVLLKNHSLLSASIEKLLQNEVSLELSIVAADDPKATAKIRRRRPQAIIIDSGDASLGEGVIPRLLEEHPQTKVIAVNLNHSGITVYQIRDVLQTDLAGLLEAIQGDGPPAKPIKPGRTRQGRNSKR